jgi:hypothetical protein
MARHPRNNAGKPRSLFIVLSLSLFVIAGLEAQERALRPSKYACPVIADLFPKQERSADTLKYVFPENAIEIPVDKAGDLSRVAQRISIALLTPSGEDIEVGYNWKAAVFTNPRIEWGERSGFLMVKGDGNPNCYFLGPSTGLPVNIPCAEFTLVIPPGVEVREVLFSSLGCEEYISEDCPMPELERQIGEAFWDSLRTPRDEVKTRRFISLLEKAIPEYGCVSRSGGYPVPALFLADLGSVWNWTDYLYQKMDETNDFALRVFAGIFDITHEGVLAEVMDDQIWKILHDRPLFILKNWPDVRSYKRNILASRWMQNPTDNIGMINIYSDIARKGPKYKSACDEIIRILSQKSQAQ